MGRLALLTVVSFGLVGCRPNEAVRELGHAALACAECHQGPAASRDLASVPPETCADSQCHERTVPGTVNLQTVRFAHRGHGSTDELAVGCAGCHTHSAGDEPISGSAGTCGLCHQEELKGRTGTECRSCHVDLSHEGFTPQGLAIQHNGVPSVGRGCSRCHYEVTEPVQEASVERCEACHLDMEKTKRAGIGVDLHPGHVSVACESCHETDTHHIESMSGVVAIVCGDCHGVEHGIDLAQFGLVSGTCVACHRESHVEQQALMIGIEPSRSTSRPAEHFTDGLTCVSCHEPGSGSRPVSAAATRERCTACHQAGYEVIGRWWVEGVRDRLSLVEPYLSAAETAVRRLPGEDALHARLSPIRERVDLVRAGGGEHNISLAHRALEDAVDAATAVFEAAGVGAPLRPELGGLPRSGFCSYCHYHVDRRQEQWDSPIQFHPG